MSRNVQLGRKMAENRAKGRRFAPACAAAALALPLALSLAPEALAQSNSGIVINNDVLNSLGPGPSPAPGAPLTPPPSYAPTPLTPPSAAPVAPLAPQAGTGGLTFQPQGSGNFVVTRPGTLLFPPLEAPKSTLAPGFADNHAARSRAMSNAFAEGPEPSSQLLIPLESEPQGSDDSIVVFMENLPSADEGAAAADAPVLTLRRPPVAPPKPAPRKPEVPPAMLAEVGVTTVDESASLAPEFQTPAPAEAPKAATEMAAPQMADVPAVAEVESAAIEEPAAPESPAPAKTEAVAEPEAMATPQMAETPAAEKRDMAAPASSADVPAPAPAPAAMAETTPAPKAAPKAAAEAAGPVSLLPAENSASSVTEPLPSSDVPAPVSESPAAQAPAPAPGVQTASLSVGAVEDVTLPFDSDSAELSDSVQAELRSLANSLRANDDSRIQVLGFASAADGSQDLARKLALSRALKVRTFLIDAGVASARIQVRSLGDKSEGGPANRVDIRPIDS